jgi:cytochrome c oxidase cbb3-type subunit 1
MSKITVAFIKAAMVYFVLAMLLGIHMSSTGAVYPSMPIHVHFNLLGWISMMVYGVAYHILPRFSGQPLWNEKLSVWHFWLANIGLIGMAFGWILIGDPGGGTILYIFAIVEGVSVVCFALNMFNTVKAATPPPPRPPARPRAPKQETKTSSASPQPKTEAKAPEPASTAKATTAKPKKKPAKARQKAKPAARPRVKKVKKEDKKESPATHSADTAPKEAEAIKKPGAKETEKTAEAKDTASAPASPNEKEKAVPDAEKT